MDRAAFQHLVCTLYAQDDLKGEVASLKIPILWLGMKNFSEWPKGMVRLFQVVKKYQVDLIHTQLFGADVMGRVVGRLSRVPVVSTIQASVYESGIPSFRSPARRWLDEWTGRLCNHKFIAVSHFVKQSVQQRLKYDARKIVVIPNSVDLDHFYPNGNKMELRRQLGWSHEDILLICVGKLNPPKGQHYLIQALPAVIRNYPRVKLLMIGKGPSEKELISLAEQLGLRDKVFFMGVRNDVKELLELSDFFVFPSLSEGMPVALLEAMAMKKPCVASDIPPTREVIEDKKTGLLVAPRSSEAIAEAVLELLHVPERAEVLASRGRDFVVEKFNAKRSAQLLETLYQDLLEER